MLLAMHVKWWHEATSGFLADMSSNNSTCLTVSGLTSVTH